MHQGQNSLGLDQPQDQQDQKGQGRSSGCEFTNLCTIMARGEMPKQRPEVRGQRSVGRGRRPEVRGDRSEA